jgi:hypothetical protein
MRNMSRDLLTARSLLAVLPASPSKYFETLDNCRQDFQDPLRLQAALEAYHPELKREGMTSQHIYDQWARRNARRRALVNRIKD